MRQLRLVFTVILCCLSAACAKEFPQRAYSEADAAFRDTLLKQTDSDSRLALARLYFEHNELDKADALLDPLVTESPGDAAALAWYGANNCKRADRAQPWLLGFYKLYRVHACLGQVRAAAAQAPDDLTVQLVLVNTGAAVDMFGSLDSAQAALDRLLKGKAQEGDRYPPGPRANIFLAAARVSAARGRTQDAVAYLERVIALNNDAKTVALATERLRRLQPGRH